MGEGSGRGSGRVGSDFWSAIASRVGSTFSRVGSGSRTVDNPDAARAPYVSSRQFLGIIIQTVSHTTLKGISTNRRRSAETLLLDGGVCLT